MATALGGLTGSSSPFLRRSCELFANPSSATRGVPGLSTIPGLRE